MSNVSRAMAIATSYLPAAADLLPGVPEVRTLQGLLDQLELAEREGQAAYDKLLVARRYLYDRPIDYVIYRKLQDELLRAQMSVIIGVSRMAGPLAGEVAALLPRPTPLPTLTYSGQARQQTGTAGVSGLRGLGFLPVVAGILAVLATLGLLYLLSDEIEAMVSDLSAVLLARARAAQQSELVEARRTAFEACRARGGAGEACLEEAERLVPTPAEAGTEINGPGDRNNSLRMLAIGGTALVVMTALGYGALKIMSTSRRGMYGLGYAGVPVRSVSGAARAADLDGSKSRYYLEV